MNSNLVISNEEDVSSEQNNVVSKIDNVEKIAKQQKYVSPQKIIQLFDITSNTLRTWADTKKIRVIRPNNGRRLYNIDDLMGIFGLEATELGNSNKRKLCDAEHKSANDSLNDTIHNTLQSTRVIGYARISPSTDNTYLDEQIAALQNYWPSVEVFTDKCSGLEWERPGLTNLLRLCIEHKNAISIIVTRRDRLCSIASELLIWLFNYLKIKIVFIGETSEEDDNNRHVYDSEHSENILALTRTFAARRRVQNKKVKTTSNNTLTNNEVGSSAV